MALRDSFTTAVAASPAAGHQSFRASDAAPAFCIRAYEPRDHDAVCALFAEGMLFYAPSAEEDPTLHMIYHQYVQKCFTLDLGSIEATYTNAGGHFWVAETETAAAEEAEVAAIVGLQDKGDGTGELRRLAVSGRYRRHGLGGKLVTHVEQWAKAHGFTAMQLNTDCVMAPALKLYDRLGYTRTHHEMLRKDYFLVWFRKLLA